jgi:hypothetical protein
LKNGKHAPQLMFEIVMIKSSFSDFPIQGFEIVLVPSSDAHSGFSCFIKTREFLP